MLLQLHALSERCLAILTSCGPWAFFAAMALLPAVGMPLMAFSLTAGPAFGPSMGIGWVVAAGLAAITFNLLLTYWLARRALRPFLEKVMKRWGHRLPKLDVADTTDLIVAVRVIPGIPFFVQNYMLGLANAPLGKYLLISCAAQWTYAAGFILFGDALLHGKGKLIISALIVLVLAFVITHFLRRHLAGRKLQHVPSA
jgi:uncharacterized membrane protein YdjX (TVP38/TMEM64 family)